MALYNFGPTAAYPTQGTAPHRADPQDDSVSTAHEPLELGSRADLYRIDKARTLAEALKQATGINDRWQLCEDFYEGHQYRFLNRETNRLEFDKYLRKYGMAMNWIRMGIDVLVIKATQTNTELEVVAELGADDAREHAEAATKMVRAWQHTQAWERMNLMMARSLAIFGVGYTQTLWNPSLIAKICLPQHPAMPPEWMLQFMPEGTEYMGQSLVGGDPYHVFSGPFGDLEDRPLTPYQVTIEPGVSSFEDATRVFLNDLVSLSQLREDYPRLDVSQIRPEVITDPRKPQGNADMTSPAYQWAAAPNPEDPARPSSVEEESGCVFRRWCYQRNARGQWERLAYVYNPPYNPEPILLTQADDSAPLPVSGLVAYKLRTQVGQFFTDGNVWDSIPAQRANNLLTLDAIIGARTSRKPWIRYRMNAGNLTETDKVMLYQAKGDPEADPVEFHTLRSNIGDVMRLIPSMQDFIQKSQALHNAAFGEFSSNWSGKMARTVLQEQMVTPTFLSKELVRGNKELVSQKLALARRLYDEPRLVGTLHDPGQRAVFRAGEMPTATVRTVVTSVLPVDESSRLEVMLEMASKGILGNEYLMQLVLEGMGGPRDDAKTLLGHVDKLRAHAEWQRQVIEHGETQVGKAIDGMDDVTWRGLPMARDNHNPDQMLRFHNEFRLGMDYTTKWSVTQRWHLDVLCRRYEMHKQMAQMAAMYMAQAQGPAAPPAPQGSNKPILPQQESNAQ